ncbi:hypothetical protein GCM10028781_17390 [Nostocoides australiense]
MSAHEWAASASIAADPVTIAAAVFAAAMSALAAKAIATVRTLSSCGGSGGAGGAGAGVLTWPTL